MKLFPVASVNVVELPAASASSTLPFAVAAGYTVEELSPDVSLVAAFMELHAKVLNALPAHGQHWVRPRSFEDVQQHLKNGHVGLGVFDAHGKMVGQALLTFPDLPGGQNLKGYPIGYGKNQLAPEQCLVVQTLGVNSQKDEHGNNKHKGIGQLLLQKAEEIAHDRFRRHLLAKTDITNKPSLATFTKANYKVSAETVVKGEDYACVFVHKPLNSHAATRHANLQFGSLKA